MDIRDCSNTDLDAINERAGEAKSPADFEPVHHHLHFSGVDRGSIRVGERLRPLDEAKVSELKESITVNGMLSPIGVRVLTDDDNQSYELMYGRHRLEAVFRLSEHRKQGDPDRTISILVFPPETPDNVVRLFEIVENLHRKELTPAEKAIHSARYIELLKRMGTVQGAKSKGAKTRESAKHSVKSLDAVLTATERLAKEEGISRQAVHDRFKKVKTLAESEGVKTDARSFEEATPETLAEIGEAAEKAARKPKSKRAAKREISPEVAAILNLPTTPLPEKTVDASMPSKWFAAVKTARDAIRELERLQENHRVHLHHVIDFGSVKKILDGAASLSIPDDDDIVNDGAGV
jgi:hypothetical protein